MLSGAFCWQSRMTEKCHAPLSRSLRRHIACWLPPRRGFRSDAWPATPIKAVGAVRRGLRRSMSCRASCSSNCSASSVRPSWSRTAGARAAPSARCRSRRPIPTATRWLVHSSAHAVAPALYPNLPYNAEADLVPMSMIGSVPNVLIIAPSQGHQDRPGLRGLRQGESGQAQLSPRSAWAPPCI